jgi:hypothetical protein
MHRHFPRSMWHVIHELDTFKSSPLGMCFVVRLFAFSLRAYDLHTCMSVCRILVVLVKVCLWIWHSPLLDVFACATTPTLHFTALYITQGPAGTQHQYHRGALLARRAQGRGGVGDSAAHSYCGKNILSVRQTGGCM